MAQLEDVSFSITRVGNETFAIYKGEKRGKLAGKGGYAKVKFAQNIHTGEWVVLRSTGNETILKKLGQYKGEYETGFYRVFNREDARYMVERRVVMDLAPGVSLQSLADSNKRLSTGKRLELGVNILKAFKNLHEQNILHRDISPNNIHVQVVTKQVIPVDFDTSVISDQKEKTRKGVFLTAEKPIVWTPGFYKSELIYTDATEIWALGKNLAVLFKPIDDPEIRKPVDDFIAKMTHWDRYERPTMSECIKFFETITKEFMLSSLINNIGYVDVGEYMAAPAEDKAKMRAALEKFDEVIFVDKEGVSKDKYVEISRELETNGINIHQEVVQYKPGKREETIQTHLKEREQSATSVDVCCFIKSDGAEEALQKRVSPEHLALVHEKLEAEIDRLKSKYGEKSQEFIDSEKLLKRSLTSLDRMSDNKVLHYDALSLELDRLQEKLISKNPLKRFFDNYFSYGPTTSQKISEIEKEIEPHVTRKKIR